MSLKKKINKTAVPSEKPKEPLLTKVLLVFLFILLSFAHSQRLSDMDLAPRLLVLSLFTGIGAIYFLVNFSGKNKLTIAPFKHPVFIAFSGWILFLLVSSFKSINSGDAQFETIKLLLIFFALLFFYGIFIKEQHPIKTVSFAATLAVTISLVYFTLNLFSQKQSALKIINESGFESFLVGNHSNKNSLAEFLLLALPLIIVSLFHKKGIQFYFGIAIALLTICTLFILKSAAVLIALFICVGVAFSLFALWKFKPSPKKTGIVILGILLLACVAILSNKTVVSRAKNLFAYTHADNSSSAIATHVNSVTERLMLWKNTTFIIKENPVTGIGLCNWKIVYPSYGSQTDNAMFSDFIKFTRPHNDYLQFWAEGGIFALLFFVSIFIFTIVHIYQSHILTLDFQHFIKKLILLLGIVSYGVVCFFGYTSERPFNLVILIIYIALIMVDASPKQATPSAKPLTLPALLVMSILFLLLSIKGFSTNFNRIKNELLLNNVLISKNQKHYESMLRYAQKIDQENFQIDYTATPNSWYLATAYFLNGNKEEAKKYYLKAYVEAPNHIQVITDVGTVYEQLGKKALAEEYFLKALKINPKFKDALLNLCAIKFNSGKVSESYQLLRNIPTPIDFRKQKTRLTDFKRIILSALIDSIVYERTHAFPDSTLKAKLNADYLLEMDSTICAGIKEPLPLFIEKKVERLN